MTPAADIGSDWRSRGALRIKHAAHILDLSESTLRRLVKADKIPCVTFGSQKRIPVLEIRKRLGELVETEDAIGEALEAEAVSEMRDFLS